MGNYYQIPHNKNGCTELNDINKTVCSSCGNSIDGTINTRRASIPAEITELASRYNKATNFAVSSNLANELNLLKEEIEKNGKAVINTNMEFLLQWLCKRSAAYNSYKRQIVDNARPKAIFEDDLKRTMIDSLLFGSEIDVVYAALTTDETGLSAYGNVTVILKTGPIEHRTSALEENSYTFVEKAKADGWTMFSPLPAGFMSIWQNKHMLAVAKVVNSLNSGISGTGIARLLLTSTNDRLKDVFIELYIYDEIAPSVVEKIKIPVSVKTTLKSKQKSELIELEKKFRIDYY